MALQDLPSTLSVLIKLGITGLADDSSSSSQKWEDDTNETVSEEKVGASSSNSSTVLKDTKLLDSPFVTMEQGRPDVISTISKEIANSAGRVSVNGAQRLLM